MLEERKKKEDI